MPPADLLARAVRHHEAGRLAQAQRLYSKVLASQPGQPDALHLLGVIAHQQGRHQQAVERIEAAIAANPRVAAFHYNLGLARRALGRPGARAAVAAFAAALELNPGHRDAAFEKAGVEAELGHLEAAIAGFRRLLAAGPQGPVQANLAQALRQAGRFAEAAEAYQDALAAEPEAAELWAGQGQVLAALGRHGEAAASFRRALEIRPDYPEAGLNLAICLRDGGQFAAALAACDDVLAGQPGDVAALATKAGVLAREGDDGAAAEIVLPLIAAGQRDSALALVFAGLAGRLDRTGEAIALLEDLLAEAPEAHWRQRCHYRLAALHDLDGDVDRAFGHYRAANAEGLDEAAAEADAEACRVMLQAWPGPGLAQSESPAAPVFVIGMPRSGTSLVEQILASHPQVFGAGELTEMRDIALDLPQLLGSQTPYPDCLAELDGDTITRAAGRYLERLAEFDAAAVIDKMPHNFLHLGLISRLFPRARVIHLRRDALDTCFSCYAQDFGERHAYSRSLGALGRTYVAYRKLMAHWRAELDLAILEIDYEDIVGDLEPAARRLVAFIGLDWHSDCLRFHENRRFVASASFDQVRQPIYDRSLGRGGRYRQHLGPLIEELGELAGDGV
ncbi:MAG: sulfotransferase [Alphaproteobacteria bacterium]|nr:sulfotransferase [Alphaproteobacteria bacterium]